MADRSSFMSTDSAKFADESWEEEDDVQLPRKRKTNDEPMSPVAVVLYVVCFYLVWQILTRSDASEILEHLPSTSPLLSPHALEASTPPPQTQQQQYHLPYALPHIPSPIAAVTSDSSSSTLKVVVGAIVYPVYIIITLIAIPLPFLVNAAHIVFSVLSAILYPITSTARLLTRTFVLAPLGVLNRFFQALYPVYVFVGGVVGVGAFLGVFTGWIGRVSLSLILGRRTVPRRRRSKRSKNSPKHHRSSSASLPQEPIYEQPAYEYSADYDRPVMSLERANLERASSYGRRYVPIVDVLEIDDDLLSVEALEGQARGTAREPLILGVRRRGVRNF